MDALLLRIPEVADLLGIGQSKVYQLVRSGRLPAVKLDGVVRIARYAVEEYIQTLPPVEPTLAPVLTAAGALAGDDA